MSVQISVMLRLAWALRKERRRRIRAEVARDLAEFRTMEMNGRYFMLVSQARELMQVLDAQRTELAKLRLPDRV